MEGGFGLLPIITMNNYIPLFKDLTAGQPVYALVKGQDLKYIEGKIISIGLQRMDMPKDVAIPRNVIDVTYELDGVNYTDTINVTDSMFPTKKVGATTLVATSKDTIVRELRASLRIDEEFLSTVDKTKQQKQKNVKQYKELIGKLDTEWAEKQALESRITTLENNSKETNTLLKSILEKLS